MSNVKFPHEYRQIGLPLWPPRYSDYQAGDFNPSHFKVIDVSSDDIEDQNSLFILEQTGLSPYITPPHLEIVRSPWLPIEIAQEGVLSDSSDDTVVPNHPGTFADKNTVPLSAFANAIAGALNKTQVTETEHADLAPKPKMRTLSAAESSSSTPTAKEQDPGLDPESFGISNPETSMAYMKDKLQSWYNIQFEDRDIIQRNKGDAERLHRHLVRADFPFEDRGQDIWRAVWPRLDGMPSATPSAKEKEMSASTGNANESKTPSSDNSANTIVLNTKTEKNARLPKRKMTPAERRAAIKKAQKGKRTPLPLASKPGGNTSTPQTTPLPETPNPGLRIFEIEGNPTEEELVEQLAWVLQESSLSGKRENAEALAQQLIYGGDGNEEYEPDEVAKTNQTVKGKARKARNKERKKLKQAQTLSGKEKDE
ncbi:hypothetical protein K469DRAFT_694986 [Zopfia rhizophila CBS 207.26]|uniref:Uncharacterized protein n=1 Tax=Zopfia rhizophila CBS 207.26 TaxID=1314779 RepID=A0A6A6DHQ7_9PEZI|nr:hypothetical protein K469DRAFT_694986 [Zopfia rhizophila CBS 207.26]